MRLIFVAMCLLAVGCAHAQIKNTGIKTHYPGTHSVGNLVNNEQNYSAQYDRTFVPADTYQGGSATHYADGSATHYADGSARHYAGGSATHYADGSATHYADGSARHYAGGDEYTRFSSGGSDTIYSHGESIGRHIVHRPERLDATAEFINKTRSQMASGICFKEVPTSSLVQDKSNVPPGNGTRAEFSRIEVCCEGYERNPHVYARCDPICQDDCPNGICTAPNNCVCIPGHVRNYEDKCISTCPIGCGNGHCNAQNECICKSGYTLEPTNRQFCVPHCDQPCQFGKCVAPNKCDCFDGYRLTAGGACEAKCDHCENGKCTAPGFCACNTGYLKVGGICEPVCALGCNRGRCIAPDTCECPKGFELDRSGSNCVAHCDQPCLNGVCDGANSCTCNTGYIPDEMQHNVCKPNCPQGCPNGYCTAPNFCICRPGYIKSGIKGRQTCIAA